MVSLFILFLTLSQIIMVCVIVNQKVVKLIFRLPLVAGRDFRWAGEADRDRDPFPPSLISWL